MEQVPDTFPSLLMGYTVFWLLLGLYILSLGLRLARLERRFKAEPGKSGGEVEK